ncbi:dihydropteroate synthase [Candidatus Sumerlaeota bacterium]|nr:dihydropteroate synthase [Candidatus Sumerlaeota bacterium]
MNSDPSFISPQIHRIEILSLEQAEKEMAQIGTHPEGIRIMAPKAVFRPIKIYALSPYQANILKQEMLSIGGEAATSKGCVDCSCVQTDVILLGALAHYERLIEKLNRQPPSFKILAEKIRRIAQIPGGRTPFPWKLPDRMLFPGEKTLIMGILNVTPDSFSDGGKYLSPDAAFDHALRLVEEGADIIDIGGESSRPGSNPISADEEMRRVLPVLEKLRGKISIPISVDTWKSEVARKAIEKGAEIVNDITALSGDPAMAHLCAEKKVGVVLMHMKGTPGTMQNAPEYKDVVGEVSGFFLKQLEKAESAGIHRDSIVLDPGIGFGKLLEHNLMLLRNLSLFRDLYQRPVLVGISRKRFIGDLTGAPVEARLPGTLAAAVMSEQRGASIIRVHEVAACRVALKVGTALGV